MVKHLIRIAIVLGLIWAGVRGYEQWQRGMDDVDRADMEMMWGDWADAIVYLERAAQREPHNLKITIKLAECFDRLGEKGVAAQLYRKCQPLFDDTSNRSAYRYHRERFGVLVSMGY